MRSMEEGDAVVTKGRPTTEEGLQGNGPKTVCATPTPPQAPSSERPLRERPRPSGRTMATPMIQRRRLGKALKRARDQAGTTQEEAAAVLDAAASKISRLELGQSGIKLTDLKLLLDFYGVTGAQNVRMEPVIQELHPALSYCMQVSPAKDTEYKLFAKDATGHSVTSNVTIRVIR